VDRKNLPDPDKAGLELTTTYVSPRSDIEQRLVKIWEEVLDVQPVGIDDNFFDLGGHSLLAAKLFARLDEEFGRLLPLSVLFAAATVRLLAQSYDNSTEAKKISPLVPLSTNGRLPPVYAVPGVYGNVVGFADLSRELGPNQPFYGLQSVGLDGMDAPLDSIESMAKLYLREIREVQAHGPYALIGACFGARVAYEMARQLLEAGEEVAFLGLLDPSRREGYETGQKSASVSGIGQRAKTLTSFVKHRLRLYSDEIRGLDRGERIKFVSNKIQSLALKIGDSKAFRGVRRELHQRQVFTANKKASKRYHRKPLTPGLRALEIFETTRNAGSGGFDWKSLWAGHPIRHHVPGKDSGDMVSGGNARVLAALLAQRLRAAFVQEPIRIDLSEFKPGESRIVQSSETMKSRTYSADEGSEAKN
jgi:thioesterase domain-containing protein/acyl carrier protein